MGAGDPAGVYTLADAPDLAEISAAWRAWTAADDGWLMIPNAELLCRA